MYNEIIQGIYNHCDPKKKQIPLPVKQLTLPTTNPFIGSSIEKQIAIPMSDGEYVVISLCTDSQHLAKFFEMNWPANTTSKKPDATIVAMKRNAIIYGLTSEFNNARWFCPDTNRVWMFDNEFYGNIKITVRGLCSEVASLDQMFVHGCAMAVDGHGVVLSGVSGAGKTTLTVALRKILGSRLRIVNDDFGPLSLNTGRLKFTGEPHLHMKYPSVQMLAPGLEINPTSHFTENFQGDISDPHARLLIAPRQVFGNNGLQNETHLKMFVVIIRDPDMSAGIRSFAVQDMPLLESGRYSRFYGKTEWFLNGSLFITNKERRDIEIARHRILLENFQCFLVNNVATPEESANLILAELKKVVSPTSEVEMKI